MKTTAAALSLLSILSLATLATGCSNDASSDPVTEDDDLTAGKIEEVFIPISNLELSTTHSAKVAKIKYRGIAQLEDLARCHQYYIDGANDKRREVIVCRDDKREIIMDAAYGDDFTRWARVRLASGRDQVFACKQISEQEFSRETYGGTTGHLCKPKAITNEGRALLADVDADPKIDEFPTRSVYLPTNWKKAQPETWSTWNEKITKAVPIGEYTGHGSTTAKKCKVKIVKEGDGLKVTVHSLDAAGAEQRVQGQALLSSASTYGAIKKDNVSQKISSAARSATVLIASSETETKTQDYYSRNVRIVRVNDAPANVEAGHTAIYIDDNYCQRLSPPLPAF